MSRNFELMTQLGLQVGVTDKPDSGTADSGGVTDVVSTPTADTGIADEEEMARFILEMFPRGGSGPKK
jgi:hypothetical protein